MPHLSVCVSICLSGCDVTQMPRLTLPQPPPPSPLTLQLLSSCIPPPGKECPWQPQCPPQARRAAQVGALCPAGPVTAPPRGGAAPPTSPSVLPATAVALRDRTAWRPGDPSTGPPCAQPGWLGVPGGQGPVIFASLLPHQQILLQELGPGQGLSMQGRGEQKFPPEA